MRSRVQVTALSPTLQLDTSVKIGMFRELPINGALQFILRVNKTIEKTNMRIVTMILNRNSPRRTDCVCGIVLYMRTNFSVSVWAVQRVTDISFLAA